MSDSTHSNKLRIVLDRLQRVKELNNGWSACCPAHDDHIPSLSAWIRDDGSIGLKCFSGCELDAILSAMNLTRSDLQPDRSDSADDRTGDRRHNPHSSAKPGDVSPAPANSTPPRPGFPTLADAVRRIGDGLHCGEPSHEPWIYHDAIGDVVGAVVRWNRPESGKHIRPFRRDAGGWHTEAMPAPKPLYRLPRLVDARRVFVTEGEKAADVLQMVFENSSDVVVTTSAGGSQAGHLSDWSVLAGKEVFVFPDNDEPGLRYADEVCNQCSKLTPPAIVRIVVLPDLPAKGDAADFIEIRELDHSLAAIRDDIERLANAAPIVQPTTGETSERLDWRLFPVDTLPPPLRNFVASVSASLNVDPSYVALPALAVCAAAVGNAVQICLKLGWIESCCLWMVLVGESGEGKTPPLKKALKPLRGIERNALESYKAASLAYQAEVATYKKAFQRWERDADESIPPPEAPTQPVCPRCLVDDFTMESLAEILAENPRGLLISRDELAGLFGSFDRYTKSRGGDASKLLELFEGKEFRTDRKTDRKTILIDRALCSVIGGIQPEILKRCLSSEHRESGLAARLMFCNPPRRIREWSEAEITPEVEAPYHDLILDLYGIQFLADTNGSLIPATVFLSEDAKPDWIKFHDSNAAERHNESGELAAAFAKLDRHAARLVLVIHLIRYAAGESGVQFERIDKQSVQAGIDLARWFGHEARRVYHRLTETTEQREERELVEWIRTKDGPITVRDLQRGPRRYRDKPETAKGALDRLVLQGRGRWELKPTDADHGGRPAQRFHLVE